MKRFRVGMSETLIYSYDVIAKSAEEASDLIYSGDYDQDTYIIYDSTDIQVNQVMEIPEDF